MNRAWICMLAALLLLTPVCGLLCQAQACEDASSTAGKLPCHESSVSADRSHGHLHSARFCDFRELPAALPADTRIFPVNPALFGTNSPGDTMPATPAVSLMNEPQIALSSGPLNCRRFDQAGSSLAPFPLVLRI